MSQYRTHNCGELRAQDAGKTVTLAGWMENLREVGGGVGFLVLRDFFGVTQVVVETADLLAQVKALNKETTIQVEGEQVTLMRVGEFNSQLVFQVGRRHLSVYNTPYGAMSVGVHTRHLLAELSDRGGDIEVDYSIEVDHALAGRSIFRINVKEAEGGLGSLKQ